MGLTSPCRGVTRGVAYLGIDPGANGGLALMRSDRPTEPTLWAMPKTEEALFVLVGTIRGLASPLPLDAACELVTGFVGGYGSQAGGNPGSGMFTFGRNAGVVLTSCRAHLGTFPQEVQANVWQAGVGLAPRLKVGRRTVEAKGDFKRRIRDHALRLFPGVKVTLKTADALLIAWWLRLKHAGKGE